MQECIRPFAVQSISDWKNAYVEECEGCSVRRDCAGLTKVQSRDSCDLVSHHIGLFQRPCCTSTSRSAWDEDDQCVDKPANDGLSSLAAG